MSPTWHIIKKDLHHFRWALAAWFAGLVYLLVGQGHSGVPSPSSTQDFFRLFSLLLVSLLSFALLAGLIQADHPTDANAFWRTRPISGGRMLGAKLALVTVCFVLVPLALVSIRDALVDLHDFGSLADRGLAALVLMSCTLSIAAVAACTRTTLQSLLLWAALIAITVGLGTLLGRTEPAASRKVAQALTQWRVIGVLGVSSAVALAVLASQYLWRRQSVAVWLFLTGAFATAFAGTMWTYYWFYHG